MFCQLGTPQLLKSWNQTGHLHPYFLSHIDFHVVSPFLTQQSLKTHHQDMLSLKEMKCYIMLKLWYLMWSISVFFKNLKYSRHSFFFFFDHICIIWKFQGQGLNWSCSCGLCLSHSNMDPSHICNLCCTNVGSLTY